MALFETIAAAIGALHWSLDRVSQCHLDHPRGTL